jgi:hypothetical protein
VVADGANPLMDVTASVSDDVHVDAAQLLASWTEDGAFWDQKSRSRLAPASLIGT